MMFIAMPPSTDEILPSRGFSAESKRVGSRSKRVLWVEIDGFAGCSARIRSMTIHGRSPQTRTRRRFVHAGIFALPDSGGQSSPPFMSFVPVQERALRCCAVRIRCGDGRFSEFLSASPHVVWPPCDFGWNRSVSCRRCRRSNRVNRTRLRSMPGIPHST